MTPARYARLQAILDRRQPDLTVLMDSLSKPHNFAAILRTCDAVGVLEAHAVSSRKQSFIASQASASGVGRYVPVRLHPTLEQAITVLRRQGLRVLAADLTPDAQDFRAIDYTLPTAILLGTERDGVPASAADWIDGTIRIPLHGAVQSLNVSVATALILYEAQRQRAAAGLYATPRVDKKTRQRLLFEWGYRRLAATYRRRGTPYPEIGPEGEILSDRSSTHPDPPHR